MRLISSILFLILSLQALAIPGDLNGNGMVGMGDLVIMAASWLTDDGGDLDGDNDTDFADFAILAAHWLEGCDEVPDVTASDVTANALTTGDVTFNLQATSSATLTYRVTSLPARGTLYDGTNHTQVVTVPFVLASQSVHYHASASEGGAVTFAWSATTAANDCGNSGTDSATATITVYTMPTATPQSITGTAYIWKTITLSATDEGLPNPPGRLKYIISTLPTVGLLYDPKSGAGHINKVPYTLSSWGTDVLYITETTGSSSFGFKASDSGVSPFGGVSSEATVSITTGTNPLDCLSFDGRGTVTIPDGTYLDVADGWCIDIWIKTRSAYAMLVDKRGTGAGYEIKLVAGRPMIQLYDASGKVGELTYGYRIDDDAWCEVGFVIWDDSAGGWNIQVTVSGYSEEVHYIGSLPDMSNSDAVLIGASYKGQFDKLRYLSGLVEGVVGEIPGIYQGLSGRTVSTDEQILGIGKISNVLWMCDEHSGLTITDLKTGKVGTFNSADHVQWHPWIVPFVDVSVPTYYGGSR